MAAWPQHCGRFVSAAVTIVLLASSCGGTITAANPHPYHPGKECGHRGQTAAALFEELRAGGCGTLEYKGPSPLLPPEIDELAELLTDDWAFRELDLSGTPLGDDHVTLLAKGLSAAARSGCRELDLSRTAIGNAGTKALARSLERALTEVPPHYSAKRGGSQFGLKLDLAGNRITDGGITELQALLPHLSELDLSGNAITDAGARGLLAALPTSALRELDLDRNQIGSAELLAQLRSSTNRDGHRIDVDAKHQSSHADRLTPSTGEPPAAGSAEAAYGWNEVYDAVEALETDGLLSADTASALRRKAASDDPAILRVFEKFGGFDADPDKLAKRLSELVPHEDL
jgi:hypothetical protein